MFNIIKVLYYRKEVEINSPPLPQNLPILRSDAHDRTSS